MQGSFVIRPVTEDDYPIIAATESAIRPEPISEDQVREWVELATFDKEFPVEWLAFLDPVQPAGECAEPGSARATFLGWGSWGKGHWLAPDERSIRVTVVHSKRRMGVGSFILEHLETLVKQDSPRAIYAWSSGSDKDSVKWAENRGYVVVRERPDSVLDLPDFDRERFLEDIERVRLAGVEIHTMWDDEVQPHMPELFRIARDTYHDVPFRSPESAVLDYRSWLREYQESKSRKVFAVALHNSEIVGYSDIWMPVLEGQSAIVEYTAVLKEYRGKGVALALKVVATAEAAKAGVRTLRTTNDPDNPAIMRLNQRLGFRLQPGRVLLKKTLASSEMS